jgi:hypothetical protein
MEFLEDLIDMVHFVVKLEQEFELRIQVQRQKKIG